MTRRQYRTAQGKVVDIGALQLQNENVRAVGNMNVNARGDIIDSKGKSIDSRNQQLSRQYSRQVASPVNDTALPSSRHAARQQQLQADAIAPVVEQETVEEVVESQAAPEPVVEESAPAGSDSGGLAAAIAKARAIKQEPLKSPRQTAQQTPGVKRI